MLAVSALHDARDTGRAVAGRNRRQVPSAYRQATADGQAPLDGDACPVELDSLLSEYGLDLDTADLWGRERPPNYAR